MDQLLPASFVVRTRRRAAWAVALVLTAVVLTPGCSHKRSSMRPVYVTPAPVVTDPCPTPGGCATPAAGAPAPSSSEPMLSPSVSTVPSPGASSNPPVSVPLIDKSTSPAGVSPPAPAPPPADEIPPKAAPGPGSGASPGGEPPLELNPADPSPTSKNKSQPPALLAPKSPTSFRDGQRTPAGRVRQATLPQQLAAVVNEPSDLFWPPKADKPWKYVVLHHSANARGSLDAIDREHRDAYRWDGCGYHFVIGNGTGSPDGQIEVAPRWANQKQGIHCRNAKESDMTEYGIGICLVGDLDKTPPTRKQIESARKLVTYLSARYQIPTARIATHDHLAASPTDCPGRLFPKQAILGQPDSRLSRR